MIRRTKRTHLLSTLWALGVLALTGLVVGFCAITASGLEREAVTRQQVRTDEVAHRIEEKFLVIEQIVRTMAGLVAPMRAREQVEHLLESVLESTPDRFVYGIGVWFKPYVFSPRDRYFGPYVHRAAAGGERPILTYEWTTPDYDFHHQPWFPRGLLARDDVAFIEPYFDTDYAYMSSLAAILDEGGAAVGVVSVGVVLPQIERFIVDESSAENETVYVTTERGALLAHPAAATILEWARGRGPAPVSLLDVHLDDLRAFEARQRPETDQLVTRATVSKLGWTVAIAADRRALFTGARCVRWGAAPIVALLWAGLLGLHLLRRRARRLGSLARDLEREELVRSILRESERRLRAILEAALHAVVGMDARGVIVDWNPQAEAMFGWPARDVLGRPASEVLLGGLFEFQRSDQAQVLNRRLETSALRRDGSELPVELLVTRIQANEGALFYAFIADISERRRVEEERAGLLERIQQRSAELQAILDSMVDGVVACDAAQRVTLMNHAASRLFGLAPGESISLDDVVERYRISSTDGGRMKHDDLPLLRALSSGAVARGSLVGHVPGRASEIHVQSSAAPIRDSRGRIVAAVAVVRDVTSAIELEHLKDQFLEVTAHELKTPITIMKSYAQLALQDGEGLSPPLRRKLEGINRGADRIDRIVRDLLDVSQIYLGRLQLLLTTLDLRELLEETAARFGLDRSRHRVRVRAPLSARVRGDRRRLENVVSTLLDNAVRYSPGGGDVEVTLTVERDEAIVAVEDHGIGIPTKGQSRIFERFYRAHSGTDQDYGGLGVGLYISKQMVELLGGRMWFQSEEGGSRFMFSLPLAPEEGPGS